ncbi:MAG: glycosyltransferase family 4 protein [Desulfobacterales bacterium]|nr:MAG: glycosyltransferase family 4 protein [Desulfobacterales bacterium]
MKHLRKYFDHLLNFDHRSNRGAVDRCHNLLVTGSVLARKPQNVLELGIGTGYLTWSLIYALRYNGMGQLTCVDNWFDWGMTEPAGINEIRSAGVQVIAPVSEEEFVKQSPSNVYDFLISDADQFLSGLWVDELLRICRHNAFMFFRNTNLKDDLPNLQLIEKRIKQLGLNHYHFTETSREDERCYRGWLFAINEKNGVSAKYAQDTRGAGNPLTKLVPGNEPTPVLPETGRSSKMLYLGLVAGKNYGWGVCSEYLTRELSKITCCHVLRQEDGTADNSNLNGKLFQALTCVDFWAMFEHARGKENYGYTFFENELSSLSIENAKKYNLVLGGSTWCRDRMLEKGITNCDVLIQGIDPHFFYPITEAKRDHNFVIFSGGKFELRKGQDLVLKAIKILQEKYPDIVLINCWYNKWPESAKLMAHSQHIKFEYQNQPWQDLMRHTYVLNGLDPARIQTLDLVANEEQREIYRHTDLGIFPNRCEGGTNLVLMEYMACGKPVIASNTSGHKDIVSPQNALLLNDLRDVHITGADGGLMACWQEPSLDELVAQIEYAYHHREEINTIGQRAGEDLKKFTWSHSAQQLLDLIGV